MAYVTGKTIKELREKRKLTQKELAEKLQVSDKAVSKLATQLSTKSVPSFETTELCALIRLVRNRENEISSPTQEAAQDDCFQEARLNLASFFYFIVELPSLLEGKNL